MEKKLTKANIVSTNIPSAAEEIRDENHAPMALRLSGQLLLGVVKIYSRKARYLLDDCNDALLKIKMAFRPGNVDLSTATVRSAQAQAAHLLMPDTLTELDLMMPSAIDLDDFDFDAPLSTANLSRRQDITLDRSLEFPRGANLSLLELEDEEDPLAGGVDLDLDIGLDDGPSIELGRRAASEMPEDAGQSYQDLDTTFDKLPEDQAANLSAAPEFVLDDIPEFQEELVLPTTPRAGSPLGGLGDADRTPRNGDMDVQMDIDVEDTPRPARQGPRKRKIVEDSATEIPSRTVSANLRDTSAIRKKQRFLAADPNMLNAMQKSLTGGFALDVFAPSALNPSIRSLLAPEFLRRMALVRQKRKRDEEERGDDATAKQARTDAAADVSFDAQLEPLSELDLPDMSMPQIPEDDFDLPALETETVDLRSDVRTEIGPEYATLEPPGSDPTESTQSLVESQTQVTALDTKEAVKQIQDSLQESRSRSVTFESMSSGTTRAAASELFFQVLLLATKDAIKVKQTDSYGRINIEARPSLSTMTFDSQTQTQIAT